jgi:hypothetical protein
MEARAALQIQRWWRMISAQQLIVAQVRQEFEEMCNEIRDAKPDWPKAHLCLPTFPPLPPDVERLWLEHAIARHLSTLKYGESLPRAQ